MRHQDVIINILKSKFLRNGKIVGAEVGVLYGTTSNFLLKTFLNLTLYMVDRWEPPTLGDSYFNSDGTAKYSKDQFHAAYVEATKISKRYDSRGVIIKAKSNIAAQKVPHGLDFVFIDGDHTYAGVVRDINIWVPKVKVGGIVLGHDYVDSKNTNKKYGVKQAVDEHFPTAIKGNCKVWWVTK